MIQFKLNNLATPDPYIHPFKHSKQNVKYKNSIFLKLCKQTKNICSTENLDKNYLALTFYNLLNAFTLKSKLISI